MLLDLSEILKEKGAQLEYKDKVVVDFPKEEIEVNGPADVDLTFTNAGDTIWANGTVSAFVKLACSRCLKEIDSKIVFDVEEELKKGATDEDDVVFGINEENKVDLSEIIRQGLILNIPIKTVCESGCKGLGDIKGPEKKIDPRFEKLKEIKF